MCVAGRAPGLNMLNQAREFHETVGLTGLVLTKLDGTARGGAVVSVVDALRLPVKFIGAPPSLLGFQDKVSRAAPARQVHKQAATFLRVLRAERAELHLPCQRSMGEPLCLHRLLGFQASCPRAAGQG